MFKSTRKSDNNLQKKTGQAYSGLKAKLSVMDVEIKSPKANNEIGAGLREMLENALKSSNRFMMVEPKASVPASATPDLIITAVLKDFEPQVSGGNAGIGGGGGAASGILGGLLGTSPTNAYMALEIKIVNTATSEVLSSTLVQGQASEGAAGTKAASLKNLTLGSGLSGYTNTPMEKAIRICIVEAVRYISQTIPANYYKY